jgi:diguanylate cyclase (GGDEF)-like protein
MRRSQITKKPLSIVFIDLDYFKQFNEMMGFQAGDDLLQKATQVWKQHLRRVDWLVRYGREEFGLILPGCDAENAVRLTERLREEFPDGQTFSAGIATWDTQEELQNLVKRAEMALYQAKQTGRNRTVVASV